MWYVAPEANARDRAIRKALVDANSGDSAVQGVRRDPDRSEAKVTTALLSCSWGKLPAGCSGNAYQLDMALEKQTHTCDSLGSQEGHTCVRFKSLLPRDGSI
jgi:hypothetical protein